MINSASSLSFDDHAADGLPTVRRYAVNVSFVSPPRRLLHHLPRLPGHRRRHAAPRRDVRLLRRRRARSRRAVRRRPRDRHPGVVLRRELRAKPAARRRSAASSSSSRTRPIRRSGRSSSCRRIPAIDTTVGTGIDPVTNGASFQVYNANGSGESVCFSLPSTAGTWEANGKPPDLRYSYKDADAAQGPCKIVKIKDGKLLRVVCLAKVQPIDYSLDEPTQGAMAVRFTSGATTYCATFGGEVKVDSGTDPPNPRGRASSRRRRRQRHRARRRRRSGGAQRGDQADEGEQ